jgi:predicted MFS family arabinose efflux permease
MEEPPTSINLPSTTSPQHDDPERSALTTPTSSLPATDGGPAAWRLLLTAFVFEALLWGFPLSFGIFQSYYSTLPTLHSSRYTAVIGTTASGISYLGAPLITPIVRRYAPYRKHMIWVGWPLCIIGLLAGSFANSLGTLVLTQGVCYGVGFLIFYYPILSMVDEFWVRRRGMAYGLMCSASGVSGAVMPLVLQALLRKYGFRVTLRAIAVALVVLTGPLIPLLQGRGEQRGGSLRTDWSFLKKRLFWTYSVGNLLMGLGYFFPSLYLTSYAESIGLSGPQGALLLALMSVSQVFGQFTFGFLSDRRVPLNTLIFVSLTVAATATFSIWALARSLPPLIFFALLYGFFGAGYTALWGRMVTAVSEEPAASQSMFSLFCAGKGVGNVLAGPISAGLLGLSKGGGGYAHGMYKAVVIFTGGCLFLSAGSLGVVYFKPKR